jgi:hypothetical protein
MRSDSGDWVAQDQARESTRSVDKHKNGKNKANIILSFVFLCLFYSKPWPTSLRNPDAGRRSLVVSLVYLQAQPDHSTIDHHITGSIQRRLSRKRMRFQLFTRIPYTVRLIGEISRMQSCCRRLSIQQEQCCSCPSEEPMQNSKERVNTLYSISWAYRLVIFYICNPVIITYVKQHLRASEDVGTGESIDPFGHLPIKC